MYWDNVAKFYDFFEEIVNKKVYKETGEKVAQRIKSKDIVLECACGSGAISKDIAPKCFSLVATDFSEKMLEETRKKLKKYSNVTVEYADIRDLKYSNESFDKVIAGNVIHLLDNPYEVINELNRVCKKNGEIIIPTYINMAGDNKSFIVKLLEKSGAGFKRQFNLGSYKKFFIEGGYENVSYDVVEGKMPCVIAII